MFILGGLTSIFKRHANIMHEIYDNVGLNVLRCRADMLETNMKFINLLLLKCCFTSTETVGLLRTGAQDGHFDFHTAPEL